MSRLQRSNHRPSPQDATGRRCFESHRQPDLSSLLLDDDELEGVLAHELSHVANRDILIGSIAAALAMGITMVARTRAG